MRRSELPSPFRARQAVVGCLLAAATVAACTPRQSVDLLSAARSRLDEAEVGGRDARGVAGEIGRVLRIGDVSHATLPATPPSRLVLAVDVPRGGRLVLAAGIPRRHHRRPGVEFVVKVRRQGDERAVVSRLVDPLNRQEDRSWIPLEADLSEHAGRAVQIVLETRGYEESGGVDHAFWGTPVITTTEAPTAPLVIVYLVDTLRADHLPLYGYERDTAPELGRFARDAVVFDQAIAASSWTKPSVASVFTSLLPSEHRCLDFHTPLDPALVTLAEMLQAHGYATGAVVTNQVIHAPGANFDQGFTYFAVPRLPELASDVVNRALDYLDARRGLPTFLYVHTMDPHSPYTPPPPFDRRFGPAPAAGRAAADPRSDYQEAADLDRMRAQYDGEIAFGDQEFGRFVRELQARGVYEGALLVFLSDHGEEFLEHGGWMHGQSVFDEVVRVPLVVKYPGNRWGGQRVTRQVELVDVLPTVLKSQGLPVPQPPTIRGTPLQDAPADDAADALALSEVTHRGYVVYGARTRADKYVRELSPESTELYFDLVRDPGEKVNRLGLAGSRARAMRPVVAAAMTPAVLRYHLRVVGPAIYELQVRTAGWIEKVDAVGLGPGEHAQAQEDGQRLSLVLRPEAGRSREIAIQTRPHGVPLSLAGTRDGRPLQARDIRVGADGIVPGGMPFQFPQVEQVFGLFSPPPGHVPGVHVWAATVDEGDIVQYDREARERLKALGYID